MRQPRRLQDGARYHVVARANRKEMIMESSAMKDLFIETVARAKKKYDFRIENFCVLGNHFHMIVKPMNGTNLSAIMQWIMSVFAMKWNRIHNITGHVWGGRFFSRLIASLLEFLQVFRYIDDNPIKACQTERADEWRHGGLWHFRQGLQEIVDALPPWLALLFPGHRTLALV
jgi:putative transposase